MIYIGISLLIGIISIGIAFYVRYKIEEDKFIKKLELKQTQKIWKKNEEFQIELKHYEDLYSDTLKRKEDDFKRLLQQYDNEEIRLKNEFMSATFLHNQRMNEIKERRTQAEFDLKVLEDKREHLNEVLNTYYESEQNRISDKIKHYTDMAIQEMKNTVDVQNQILTKDIEEVQQELEKYQAMRAAINENIMRERQLQEQSEFYTINLSDAEIADLLMIKELSPRFNNRELLNKIIYESYIKRPLQEMIKRVLGGRSPSGIYKITRKSTGEIYIGRAVSVDKRWTEHAKMAFSIGSIAHSTLHTLMEKDGIWNYTFELLEEVPKEQLNEREKYYIDFYDSKNFGLNQKNGG